MSTSFASPPPPSSAPVLLQNSADPTIRNTDGKTAFDLGEPLAKEVLSGDYKKEELLEAARYDRQADRQTDRQTQTSSRHSHSIQNSLSLYET